mmetsp:Transcript_14138/g.38793  ORF Transcript_14138/g.38793 Transcript_14138/m.38793 type:complete len:237 (-) Transcript_14138:609-1319(-)
MNDPRCGADRHDPLSLARDVAPHWDVAELLLEGLRDADALGREAGVEAALALLERHGRIRDKGRLLEENHVSRERHDVIERRLGYDLLLVEVFGGPPRFGPIVEKRHLLTIVLANHAVCHAFAFHASFRPVRDLVSFLLPTIPDRESRLGPGSVHDDLGPHLSPGRLQGQLRVGGVEGDRSRGREHVCVHRGPQDVVLDDVVLAAAILGIEDALEALPRDPEIFPSERATQTPLRI